MTASGTDVVDRLDRIEQRLIDINALLLTLDARLTAASSANDAERVLSVLGAAVGRAISEQGALSGLASAPQEPARPAPAFARTTVALPWSERTLRQALILDDIVSRGGTVSRQLWYDIARHYGYEGRGLAGFFRGGKNKGLLAFADDDSIEVTEAGLARLHENRQRVELSREECPPYGRSLVTV